MRSHHFVPFLAEGTGSDSDRVPRSREIRARLDAGALQCFAQRAVTAVRRSPGPVSAPTDRTGVELDSCGQPFSRADARSEGTPRTPCYRLVEHGALRPVAKAGALELCKRMRRVAHATAASASGGAGLDVGREDVGEQPGPTTGTGRRDISRRFRGAVKRGRESPAAGADRTVKSAGLALGECNAS
jgi:hypothetical protein